MVIAIIVFVVVVLFLFVALYPKNQTAAETGEKEVFKDQQKFATEHVSGHPRITEAEYVYLVKEAAEIKIAERKLYEDIPFYTAISSIPYKDIISVETANRSTIEKKFSIGKFMLIGVYAFAWLKKEALEHGYLLIKWKDGDLEPVSIFKNEGKGALKDVTLARNAILHWIKENENKVL